MLKLSNDKGSGSPEMELVAPEKGGESLWYECRPE
jgi:hypothetical protein